MKNVHDKNAHNCCILTLQVAQQHTVVHSPSPTYWTGGEKQKKVEPMA